jgi:hypothetical protein
MATTVNEITTHAAGGLNLVHLKLTAGAADTTVTFTFSGTPIMKLISAPFKTTGAIGAQGVTYVESTGVLTVQCANNDVVRITCGY